MKRYNHKHYMVGDMRTYQYSEFDKKLNKKRLVALAILIIWTLFRSKTVGNSDWLLRLTEQMIPLLTYEKQYGNLDVDYAADYSVPEWFFEDEEVGMTGGDTVMEETVEVPVTNTPITTLKDGENGTVYTRKQLGNKDFLLEHIFVVDSNTSMTEEELNLDNLLDTDLSIDGWKPKKELTGITEQRDNPVEEDRVFEEQKENLMAEEEAVEQKKYKILIYHTHGSESFIDSRDGKKEDTIIGVGSYLTRILEEEYGISVYHDETAYDIIDGELDRSKAYENAYNNVTKILEENPSIEVVIDLHRDGVGENTHLVTEINGKPTAKIMFLNGVSRSNTNGEIEYLHNPNKLMNLAFSFQMYLAGKEHYEDYVRKIFVRSYRYNLHLLPRTTLIEAGAQTNTVEEEKNAMEPLAAILYKVLSKQK